MEKVINNEEIYEKLSKLESDIGEVKDLLLHVQQDTSSLRANTRGLLEQFGINVASNILADELFFRPLKRVRGEL